MHDWKFTFKKKESETEKKDHVSIMFYEEWITDSHNKIDKPLKQLLEVVEAG